ncbi:hypothetical protein [Georgenia subflava]|uniref:Uncharacterized protein n=1 Tax=Georgenia subflava TaxID=1622177 RepID=A0A6N7EIZ7_9MICO|nr:hypothetical protein [Georgenia subflava]MPV36707.1 hypothetical protein [Georgenia subflava]
MEIPRGLRDLSVDQLTEFGIDGLHVGVFYQQQMWTDRWAVAHPIDAMGHAYRRNAIMHLLDHAENFHGSMVRHILCDRIESIAYGTPEPEPLPRDPIEWLEATPLMRRLRELEPGAPRRRSPAVRP